MRSNGLGAFSCELSVLFLAIGCASDPEAAGRGPDGSRGFAQSGARDIEAFRAIVASGAVPSPDVLDQNGFFAEHNIELPTCDATLCPQASLSVVRRFDGSVGTMAYVAMNSRAIDAILPRPATHVGLVLDGTLRDYRNAAAEALASGLVAGDHLSVYQADETTTRILQMDIEDEPVVIAPAVAYGNGGVDLYAGLSAAFEEASLFEGAKRVVLVSSGNHSAGIRDAARIENLVRAYASLGVACSVIDFTASGEGQRLLSVLGELGVGSFATARDETDLLSILRDEALSNLVPAVTDFELHLQAAPGYRMGRRYGMASAVVSAGEVSVQSPALFHAARSEDYDPDGRRGGASGLFVELLPSGRLDIAAEQPAFTVTVTWREIDGTEQRAEVTLNNPLRPGELPSAAYYSDDLGKAFMMLNLYLALRETVQLYYDGDCRRARGVSTLMVRSVEYFLEHTPDVDIQGDLELLLALRGNIDDACTPEPELEPSYEGW